MIIARGILYDITFIGEYYKTRGNIDLSSKSIETLLTDDFGEY